MINRYMKELPPGTCAIDVYDVICLFGVSRPGLQHAIKKILFAGTRGHKDVKEDLEEAVQAIQRQIELEDLYGTTRCEATDG